MVGVPPPSPPWSLQALTARCWVGGSFSFGARSACSFPPSPSPSSMCPLSLQCPWGYLHSPGDPWQLGPLPSSLVLVSRTHDLYSIYLCCAPLWALQRRRLLTTCHLLSAACVAAPLGDLWLDSLHPLLAPGFLPWALCRPQGSLRSIIYLGHLFHSGGVGSPRRLNPPSHSPWKSPLGFSTTPEALGPSSLSLNPEDSPEGFSCRPEILSFYLFPAPWRPPALSRWRPRRLLHPLERLPRSFSSIPLSFSPASFRPCLAPPRSWPPPSSPTPLSPICSTRHFRLRSPPCLYCL